jgi:hypothetical protein
LTRRGCAKPKDDAPFRQTDRGWKRSGLRVLSCADPKHLQQICDGLTEDKINALLRKWLRLLPHPFTRAGRYAGYRHPKKGRRSSSDGSGADFATRLGLSRTA